MASIVVHLFCGSDNGKDTVGKMSTNCVNDFQRLTILTGWIISLEVFERINIKYIQTCMLSAGQALYLGAKMKSC